MYPTRPRLYRTALVAALALFALTVPGDDVTGPNALSAQIGDAIEPGTLVRFAAPLHGLRDSRATVQAVEDGRLVLDLGAGRTLSLEPSMIEGLQVGTVTGDRAVLGFLIGAGAGALVGAGLGHARGDDPECRRPRMQDGSSAQGLIGAIFAGIANSVARAGYERCVSSWKDAGAHMRDGALTGGIAGALLGFGLGRAAKVERWTRVDVAGADFTILPTVGASGTGVSITLPLGN